MKTKKFYSRKYWDNSIETIIESIREDKDTIIDMLMYGNLESVKITMDLSPEKHPTYQLKVNKLAEKSPFEEEDDE